MISEFDVTEVYLLCSSVFYVVKEAAVYESKSDY